MEVRKGRGCLETLRQRNKVVRFNSSGKFSRFIIVVIVHNVISGLVCRLTCCYTTSNFYKGFSYQRCLNVDNIYNLSDLSIYSSYVLLFYFLIFFYGILNTVLNIGRRQSANKEKRKGKYTLQTLLILFNSRC